MKFLLCMISLLIWAELGNAASRYYFNDTQIYFREESLRLSLLKENYAGDGIVAVNMRNNNIDAKRYSGILPENEYKEFGSIGGEVFITTDERRSFTSFSRTKLELRGNKFEFNEAIFMEYAL